MPHNKWKPIGTAAKQKDAENMIDGNPNSALLITRKITCRFFVDLGEQLNLKGFTYLPDQRRGDPGIIFNYAFYVSLDGKNWGTPVSKGEFANIKNSPVLQKINFKTVRGRYIKLQALSSAEENDRVGVAELDIITE